MNQHKHLKPNRLEHIKVSIDGVACISHIITVWMHTSQTHHVPDTLLSINEQPPLSHPRRRSIIRDFALNTSAHALPGIARSQTLHNRLFWGISFVAFTGTMIFFIAQSIYNYFQYDTQTTISIVVERDQVFPAVTFCNICPARYDLLKDPLFEFINLTNLTSMDDRIDMEAKIPHHMVDFLIHSINTRHDLTQYFFALETMLIGCSYNAVPCNQSDFISFVSPDYGLCYTFNTRLKRSGDSRLRRVNDNGGPGTLQLHFYIHNHLYVPNVSDGTKHGSS